MIRTTFIIGVVIFSCLFRVQNAHAQQGKVYDSLVTQAFGLYEIKEYKASAQKYAEAFAFFWGKGYYGDRYNAACSWALAAIADSAFVQLFKMADNGSCTDLEHISSDSDLNSLHPDNAGKS